MFCGSVLVVKQIGLTLWAPSHGWRHVRGKNRSPQPSLYLPQGQLSYGVQINKLDRVGACPAKLNKNEIKTETNKPTTHAI